MRKLRGVMIGFAGSFVALFSVAHAGEITDITPVSSWIDDGRDAVENIIANADNAVSSNTFQARNHALLILEKFDLIAEKSGHKLFKELRATERQLFEDIDAQLEDLKRAQKVVASDLEKLNNSFATGLGNTIIAKKSPLITSYTPGWVKSTEKDKIPVEIKGISLGYGNPTLKIGNESCKRTGKISTKISFECPGKFFRSDERINSNTASLTTFEKKGWFFGKIEHEYELSTFVVPNKFGTYSVTYLVEGEEKAVSQRSQPFSDGNPHCRKGGRNKSFNFTPADVSWSIDVNSIKPTCNSSSKSRCTGLANVSSEGFQYNCMIANNGDCIKVFGEVVSKDGRGSCHGSVNWSEFKMEKSIVPQDGESGELFWGRDISFNMPDGAKGFALKVEQKLDMARPTTMIVEGTDNSQDWFTVSSNIDIGTLILSPRSLETALKE